MTLNRGLSVAPTYGGINSYATLGVPPAQLTGLPPGMGAMAAGSGTPLDRGDERPWHPDNPLFWFGVILAATFGLIGASTAIRVGPFRASAGAGKT